MSDSQQAVNGATQMLPPMYSALEPVTFERHGKLRLHDSGFGFASTASAVPIAAEEFAVACRSVPIVFAAQAPHLPVALTGLAAGTNLFVNPDGTWRAGTYIPAYLRRVPLFLVRRTADSDEMVLCIDPNAPQVSTTQGEALFADDGKATPHLERALGFCRSVEEAILRTRAISTRLAELGLLKPSVVEFQHNGKPMRVDGFYAVDRPALQALPTEQLAELRDKGWLEPIYAHLLSIGGLADLARDITTS